MVYFSIQRYQEIRRNFGNDFDKNFHVSLLNLTGQISQVANHGVIVPDHVTNLVMVYETGPQDLSLIHISKRNGIRRLSDSPVWSTPPWEERMR